MGARILRAPRSRAAALLDLKPFLTPARQKTITDHYRVWQARTSAQRHPEFEAQLGVR